jgi:hypothetical protein
MDLQESVDENFYVNFVMKEFLVVKQFKISLVNLD